MLSQENIKSHIAQFLSLGIDKVKDEALLKDLVTDSFVLIDLVIDLQNTFNVRLVQDDLVNVNSVLDLTTILKNKSH